MSSSTEDDNNVTDASQYTSDEEDNSSDTDGTCDSSNEDEHEHDDDAPLDREEKFDHVDVSFQLLEPNENKHMPGIRNQLRELSTHLPFDVFDVTDAIVEQVNIGAIVAIPDLAIDNNSSTNTTSGGGDQVDHVIVGTFTILNLEQHQAHLTPLLNSLCNLLSSYSDDATQAVKALLTSNLHRTGLLLTERIKSGLPPDLVREIYTSLVEDVQWSLDAEDCPPEEKAYYRFRHLVGLGWAFLPTEQEEQRSNNRDDDNENDERHTSRASSSVSKRARMEFISRDQDIIDFQRIATHWIPIPVKRKIKSADGKSTCTKHLVVFVVPWSTFCQEFKPSTA